MYATFCHIRENYRVLLTEKDQVHATFCHIRENNRLLLTKKDQMHATFRHIRENDRLLLTKKDQMHATFWENDRLLLTKRSTYRIHSTPPAKQAKAELQACSADVMLHAAPRKESYIVQHAVIA